MNFITLVAKMAIIYHYSDRLASLPLVVRALRPELELVDH